MCREACEQVIHGKGLDIEACESSKHVWINQSCDSTSKSTSKHHANLDHYEHIISICLSHV